MAVRHEIKEGEKRLLKAIEKEEIITSDEKQDVYQVAVELCNIYRFDLMDIIAKLRSLYPENEVPSSHIAELQKQTARYFMTSMKELQNAKLTVMTPFS